MATAADQIRAYFNSVIPQEFVCYIGFIRIYSITFDFLARNSALPSKTSGSQFLDLGPASFCVTMPSHRSRSGSPDVSNKRTKYSSESDRRHHQYRYEDEDYSRSRYRDDRGDSGYHTPHLYRVDDRGSKRDNGREQHRINRDGSRDDYYRHEDRERRRDDYRKHDRRYYDEDERYRDRKRGRERSRERIRDHDDKDGKRANVTSPRHSTGDHSGSPSRSSPLPRSPNEVCCPQNIINESL